MTLEKYVPVEDPLSIEGKISLNFLEKYPLKMNDLSSSFVKRIHGISQVNLNLFWR